MSKELKKWNGRVYGIFGRWHNGKYKDARINIAAYSRKHASEILSIACQTRVAATEIAVYFSDCWGNNMIGVEPTEPSVWVVYRNSENKEVREQVYPKK